MKRNRERGVALIMAMTLILIMSVMAISLTYLARGETLSSMNYRLMSQARDAAEGGVNKASNYLMFTYAIPGPVGGDPMGNYNLDVSPVTSGGNPVILSAGGGTANYPISSVSSAFSSAAQGSVASGTTTINYSTSAKLLFMRQLSNLPAYLTSGGNNTVQTWEITSTGTVAGYQPATVTVVAKLERRTVPIFGYAAFATYNGCDALDFGGGGNTNSYSSAVANTDPATMYAPLGGNVGTNGGLSTVGAQTNIGGTLSTPRIGVGSCTASTITALDGSPASVDGGLVQLPTTITYPTPPSPSPMPPTTSDTVNNSCGLTGCTAGAGSKNYLLAPNVSTPAGNISINGGATIHLSAGTYTFNSLSLNGGSTVVIDSGPVVLQIGGVGVAMPLDFNGGNVSNIASAAGYPPNPQNFQIVYAGTGSMRLNGGAGAGALVYAPNASLAVSGGTDFYGALLGKYITDFGGAAIHYDRQLQTDFLKGGPYTLDSFNWKKF